MTIYSKATDMKIVVSQSTSGKPNRFTIQVFDGSRVVDSRNATGLVERDKIVWELADLYDALDIELRGKVALLPEEFRFSEIPSIPVLTESEADDFFEQNLEFVYNRIVQAVTEGVVADRETIRLFELNGTGVYITSDRPNWKMGLHQAMQHFITEEAYEKCAETKKILEDL